MAKNNLEPCEIYAEERERAKQVRTTLSVCRSCDRTATPLCVWPTPQACMIPIEVWKAALNQNIGHQQKRVALQALEMQILYFAGLAWPAIHILDTCFDHICL